MHSRNAQPRPLSASLLASKGTARPSGPRNLFDLPAPQKPAPKPPAQSKRSEPRPETARKPKAAFTFRMDEKRHFRLRLLSAHQNRSSQKILEDALDAYLDANAPATSGLGCACFSEAHE